MVKEQRLVLWTAIILVATFSLCGAFRLKVLRRSHLTRGESVWRLTYDIEFPQVIGGKAFIAIPDNSPSSRVFRETFSHQGIWMDILRTKRTLEREAVIVPIVGYEQGRFIAEFDIYVKANETPKSSPPAFPLGEGGAVQLTAEEIAHYLQEEKTIQLNSYHLSSVVNQQNSGQLTKDKLLENIFEYCCQNIVQGGQEDPCDALGTLQKGYGTTLGRARAMIALCRVAKIPARLVTGLRLESSLDARQHCWVEVYWKKCWLPCDPENGYYGSLPATYLPIRRDSNQIVRTTFPQSGAPANPHNFRAKYSIRRLLPSASFPAQPLNRLWNIVDLTRLSSGMQEVVGLILLLPLGALITAIFRNLIGIETFGTFTPCLIALSFVQADWRTGAVVFFVVLTLGILARLLLNKLKLLMVARLGIILTLVVLSMILAVSILDYLSLTPSARAVLLPMVILTMMIERFHITAEQDGLPEAFKMFAGTLVVAVCCLAIFSVAAIGRSLLAFPEVQLLIAAVLLLIGRYSGYRLTELWRFRDIPPP